MEGRHLVDDDLGLCLRRSQPARIGLMTGPVTAGATAARRARAAAARRVPAGSSAASGDGNGREADVPGRYAAGLTTPPGGAAGTAGPGVGSALAIAFSPTRLRRMSAHLRLRFLDLARNICFSCTSFFTTSFMNAFCTASTILFASAGSWLLNVMRTTSDPSCQVTSSSSSRYLMGSFWALIVGRSLMSRSAAFRTNSDLMSAEVVLR